VLARFELLRNVGLFDSVSECRRLLLLKLTLVYAENGRGKTTLAAILRSLGTGDPIPIAERKRLTASHPPHVVVEPVNGGSIIFENGNWSRPFPDLVIFDDVFVDQNIHSGLVVGADHRQKLHELILGAQGVVLNRSLQRLVEKIEDHNRALRTKGDAIPATARGVMSVDDFCALKARLDIDAEIQAAERNLAAAREQDAIRNAASLCAGHAQ
jgi:wobble nucleotide-excising tRNase